jgi:hypothetical protein
MLHEHSSLLERRGGGCRPGEAADDAYGRKWGWGAVSRAGWGYLSFWSMPRSVLEAKVGEAS